MDITTSRKIIERIQTTEHDLAELRRVRTALASAEYASATMSSGGGSRSYTRADVGRITQTIRDLEAEVRQLRRQLATGGNSPLWSTVNFVWY